MSGYIGATVVGLDTTAADVTGDITASDTSPELTLKNSTHEDTDGGREGKITFKGEQSGGEESTLAQIQASHDGTSDDEKGDLIFKTNDGNDGAAPTERLRLDSAGDMLLSSPDPSFTITNTTEEDTDGGRESTIVFKGEQSGGELSTLAEIEASHDGTADDEKGDLIFKTNDGSDGASPTERMRIDSDGDISFAGSLNKTAGTGTFAIDTSGSSSVNLTASSSMKFTAATGGGSDSHQFINNTTEAMRIDSSGNLMVGKTSTSFGTAGILMGGDVIHSIRNGSHPLALNRLTSDGDIAQFYRDSSQVGAIGCSGGFLTMGDGTVGLRFIDASTDRISPFNLNAVSERDNAIDLGEGNARFDDIYATNGTIQTSDRNEKQDIEDLSEAELRVATAAKGLIKKYRWIDAVEKKGDDARIHVGIIAQDLQAAFEAEGLDASRYAMFISDTWWEADRVVPAVEANEEEGIEAVAEHTVTDTFDTQEEAPEGATERTRLGVRYPELLAFIIGAM